MVAVILTVVNVWFRTRALPIFTSQFHQQGTLRQISRTAGHPGPLGRGAVGLLGNWSMGPQRRLDIRQSGYRITVARQKAKARKGNWSAELLCHWAAGHFARLPQCRLGINRCSASIPLGQWSSGPRDHWARGRLCHSETSPASGQGRRANGHLAPCGPPDRAPTGALGHQATWPQG